MTRSEPSLWVVDIHDDYGEADMAFLVAMFMKVFNSDLIAATQSMMELKRIGRTSFGPSSKEIAKTRVGRAQLYLGESGSSVRLSLRDSKTA